ncbi:hypothetical protein E6C50_03950 [Flavobacterium supellecticarium]|uniref:Uncharacterized protein n=1 Tax=Flavobacterium supellecticarium TaxID=2565924 RepID=A0A4S4A5Z2_9FLAO|nr:hypothetical protein [Flavobacterium supellecticarium]THF53365.1 hypothetical protein E6C50_03950 [Flavobacterium supellecticarium]
MNGKVYDKTNFFKHTFCIFREVAPDAVQEKKFHYTSKSGSSYYFTEEGVYRNANHWGRAANCRWRLLPLTDGKTNNAIAKTGYAKWTDFYPNNETENLFYIEWDPETDAIHFQHKSNPEYNGNAVLRNAAETTKRIQLIKKLFETDNWADYLKYDDFEALRKTITEALITTNKTLQQIKQPFL